MRFSLAISHTPWIKSRVDSMARLLASVIPSYPGAPPPHAHAVFADKAPNHVWSAKMWEWAAAQDVDWCVFLQDDAVVSPNFWGDLREIVELDGLPIVGLQAPHPMARALDEEGYWGYTTADGLVGVGYAVARDTLAAFLEWRAALPLGSVEAVSEDTLLGIYAMTSGVNVYHPIPTIVDHDTSIVSTYGNDNHANRHSTVRWDSPAPPNRNQGVRIPHLGRFYSATPGIAEKYCNATPREVARYLRDDGLPEKRRLHYARLGRGEAPKHSLLVCTPTRGAIHPSYMGSILKLTQDPLYSVELDMAIADVQVWTSDVVRVRNRFAYHFLNRTDASHLLFVDDDVSFEPSAVRGMLAAGRSFVACPYPYRRGVDWTRVAEVAREDPSIPSEALAYRYPMRVKDDTLNVGPDGCAEVEGMPLGCALVERAALQRMADACTERYLDTLADGSKVMVPNLFGLMLGKGADGAPGLLSEDMAFCARWRASGEAVHAYFGLGSPVTHHGDHAYRGMIEAFNMRRG